MVIAAKKLASEVSTAWNEPAKEESIVSSSAYDLCNQSELVSGSSTIERT
jgi:hypothetical protein